MSNRAGNALGGLFALLVVFALFEIGARAVFALGHLTRTPRPYVEYPFHPYLGWENQPDYLDSGMVVGEKTRWTVRTNARGEAITPLFEDPNPQVSVVVLGGSAMYGHGQQDNAQSVPSQIERELRRRTGLRVEVHNLAVCGYTSFQEMLAVERFLSNQRADVVVSVSGFNDAVAAALDDSVEFGLLLHRSDPKIELIRSIERGDLAVVPVTANLLVQALRRASAAVDLLGKVADRLRPPAPPPALRNVAAPDSVETARRARFVLSNYAMADALTRQNGGRYFFFLQPLAMTRKALVPAEEKALAALNASLSARVDPVARRFYATLLQANKAFAFHDLTHGFDTFDGPAFADDCHYLPGATAHLASEICDVIEPAVIAAGHPGTTASGRTATRP